MGGGELFIEEGDIVNIFDDGNITGAVVVTERVDYWMLRSGGWRKNTLMKPKSYENEREQ